MSPSSLPKAICTPLAVVPDLLALAQREPARYPVLLESLGHKQSSSAAAPDWDLLLIADLASDAINAAHASDAVRDNNKNVFPKLRALQQRLTPLARSDFNIPFVGGIFVYLGFEMAGDIEPRLQLNAPAFDFPKALALRCVGAVAIERNSQQAYLVLEPEAQASQQSILQELRAPVSSLQPVAINVDLSEDDPQQFLHGVEKVQAYLHAGDVFQVNLSRGYQAHLPQAIPHAQLYANLRAANPSPFSGLLQWQQFAVISSSPERLVSLTDGIVQTRPIAGTKARLPNEQDLSEADRVRFIGDKKERAEHIMLIDLERNDLGRVCKAGTVEVNELLSVESYAHVHHLVSNVRGILRADVDAIDVLQAVFPGGTITGCPKVRCIEIISELESAGRGPYTGAMGYISRDGSMDFNILIRTFAKVDHADQSHLYFRAGAGIVVDSVAEKELAETRAKAKGLLRALFVNEPSGL